MGRPRKETEPEADIVEVVHRRVDLKVCPRCGDKSTGAYKDGHGHWRCNCADPRCGFWDSQVYKSEEDAERGWNQAGGPSRREDW